MSDKNFISISGKPTGELVLFDNRLEGDKNRMLRPDGDLSRVFYSLGDIYPPGEWSDSLKISGAVNLELSVGEIEGEAEDVLDINHSQRVKVVIQRAIPKGRYVNTTKGGSRDIEIVIRELVGHGRYTDFDIGNWSDQSDKKSTYVQLNVTCVDKVKVRVLHADIPMLLNPGAGHYEVYAPWWRPAFYPVMKVGKKLRLA